MKKVKTMDDDTRKTITDSGDHATKPIPDSENPESKTKKAQQNTMESATAFSDDDEKHVISKERKSLSKAELKEYHKHLVTSERAKLQNVNKLRLRQFVHTSDKDPKEIVILTLKRMLNIDLKSADIIECEYAPSWSDENMVDIVITFRSEEIRNGVYNKRDNGDSLYCLCDELGEERAMIWKELLKRYDEVSVFTHCGAVHLLNDDGEFRFLTMSELKKHEE